ncbi:hypothetical protein COJ52_01040 [Bacillus cereus]|nr:hypothetical protein COI81_11155 [Bacillus cereus]PFM63019.1 hypothetical protein COJ52_01040 [Bacillus cereus]
MVSKGREEWTTYQFSEACNVNPNYKLERNKGYNYVEMAAVSESFPHLKYVQQKEYNGQSGSKFKNGDVLFARITPCTQNGKTAHVTDLETEYGFGSTEFIVLSPKEGMLLDKYLYYFVKDNKVRNKAIARMVGTTGRQRVPNEFFKEELEIELPSIQEQKKIADIFSTVDEAIEKTEDIIEQTEKVKKGLMQQLLTKGIGHTKFKKTEIGEIPEEWEVKVFSDVMVLQRGFDLPTHSRKEGQYPLMSANGLTDSHSEYKVKGPGIVTGRSGTIGKVHYIEDKFWPLNTTLYVKEMYENNPKFLYYLLSNFRLERFSTGTGVPTLNRNVVHIEKIAIPPVDEQQKIALILTNVDMRMIKEKQYLQELFNFKKGLMQSLFTRKIRVKFDESEVTQV